MSKCNNSHITSTFEPLAKLIIQNNQSIRFTNESTVPNSICISTLESNGHIATFNENAVKKLKEKLIAADE
ncbi:hypothetical protein OAP56_00315, partial [Rickettsiaceae bacterium]|nr:hypothetical protein [Rickettsiaceae bacterium]